MNERRNIKLCRTQDAPKPGIVHLGLGAFFRAHGAIYIKEAMERSGGDWGIIGVSLRLVLSRLRSGLPTHLCGLSFECQGAFST